jgi:transcription antitermination factor NusG
MNGIDGSKAPAGFAEPRWYALYTRSRHERFVANLLAAKGFSVFLPTQEEGRYVSRLRSQMVRFPLFPGYLFSSFVCNGENYHRIISTQGVVSIVGTRQSPIPIPNEQIESIKRLLLCHVSYRQDFKYRRGQEVMINAGPLMGLKGKLVRDKNKRVFVIVVELLKRAVLVDIDQNLLELVGAN